MIERMNGRLLTLEPSGIRRFTALAKSVDGCAMLTIGEPDFETPTPIKEACKRGLDENHTHYPPNVGSEALRRQIASFEEKWGLAYDADEVLLTIGATEAIYTAMTGVLEPGDEVIIPTPAFALYESIARMAGAVPVFLDTAATGFQITAEALNAAVTERTKLLVLNSPNNPTGCVQGQAALDAVEAAALNGNFFVLCDDVYTALSYGPCPRLAARRALKDRLLVVQSFSKPYAMTGWRVGYLMAHRPVMEKLALLHAAAVVSVAAFHQDACARALEWDPSEMVETYRSRRDYMYGRLRAMGLAVVEPMGAFYMFPSIEKYGLSSEEFCRRMIVEAKVAAVPGTCFGAEGFLRLSYCYSMEEIETGLDRMEAFLGKLEEKLS